MTHEQFNNFCASLKGTSYVKQWGGAHVWKVGDKPADVDGGGVVAGKKLSAKVFAIGGWELDDKPAFTFKTREADFSLLQSEPGFRPAPYMASRGMTWIQVFDGDIVPVAEIERNISESYRLVAAGLSKQLQRQLGLI